MIPVAHGAQHLLLALEPMGDERLDVALRVRDRRTVGRPVRAIRAAAGDLAQRLHVRSHVPVGWRDDRRAPPHHVVAREQHRLLREGEARVVRGVARCVHGAQRPARTACRDVAVLHADLRIEGEVERLLDRYVIVRVLIARRWRRRMRTEGDRRRAGLLAQPSRQRRMVAVAVGHADGGHSLPDDRRGEGIPMGVEHRARVDHRNLTLPDDVRPRAPVRELGRVLGDHSPDHRRHRDRRARRRRRRAFRTRGRSRLTDERADGAHRLAVAEDRLRQGVGATSTPSERSAATVTGMRARPRRRPP